MRTYECSCGEKVFFDDTRCDNCGAMLGFCPVCRQLAALRGNDEAGYACGHPGCGTLLVRCRNYRVENVCNRCLPGRPEPVYGGDLCDCCRHNSIIPDLTVPGNREKWASLEAAKRRLFYQLDLLGLPRGTANDGFEPPLSFDFKADTTPAAGVVNGVGTEGSVLTGHLDGKITINIREADPSERERLREAFGEPQRTLIGHFRHEVAHYYWDVLVKGQCEDAFKAVFGDHENPPYAAALERHHQQGPPANWADDHVSAYASMHPWEDFAETFAAYLEIRSTLDTAKHAGLGGSGVVASLDQMIAGYKSIGDAMNMMNRTMGLQDHSVRNLAPPVTAKLRFIHELVCSVRTVYGVADQTGNDG